MNGKPIESYEQFRNDVAMLAPDSKVTLDVLRDGKARQITVTLGERPTTVAKSNQPSRGRPQSQAALGLDVQDLTRSLANRFGYPMGEGVIVTRVDPGSPAANAGIQPGDFIQSVNRESVNSASEFERAINSIKGKKVLLLVRRGQFSQFVVVQLGE
ncbi:MAG: PDZ domain-containing protein, partial [Sedimentisphaerales bacterium]